MADLYAEIPAVKETISKKILNDPLFVKFALENVFQRAKKANYIKGDYQSYLGQFNSGQDTYQAAATIVKSFPDNMVDVGAVLKDSGFNQTSNADFILTKGGPIGLISDVIKNFLTGIVPRPLSVNHRFEKEEDGPVWIKELDMRVVNMHRLIFNLYKKDIFFVANSTNNEKGFLQEISKNISTTPKLPPPNGQTEYITYSLNEKAEFNHIIFSFLFPKLSEHIKTICLYY